MAPKQYVKASEVIPVQRFKFHEPFELEDLNGLIQYQGVCLPEDFLLDILSYVDAKYILKLSLVCKRWCNAVKSTKLWQIIYNRRKYPRKAKKLPWYVFYNYFATKNFDNMLKNGNGQDGLKHWEVMGDLEDNVVVEDPPVDVEPLPDVLDFGGNSSCFEHQYGACWKVQEISLEEKPLLRYILNRFMPQIYASEWTATSIGCRCYYRMFVKGFESLQDLRDNLTKDNETSGTLFYREKILLYDQHYEGGEWKKVELLIKRYPPNLVALTFENLADYEHKRRYSCKMAGGVIKILFDSIEPLDENANARGDSNNYEDEDDKRTWSARKFDRGIVGLKKGRILRGSDRDSPPPHSCCSGIVPRNPRRS